MNELQLSVSPNEFQTILNALGQRPFLEVNMLLNKLVTQANSQTTLQPSGIELPPLED